MEHKSLLLKTHQQHQPNSSKLARMNRELSESLSNLHSYKCEPCTTEMYYKFQRLNIAGKNLQQIIIKAKKNLREFTEASHDNEVTMHNVSTQFDLFQKEVTSYFSEAISHH